MAMKAEWILNKAKQKIYAISHAKAVVRNNSTVDADLTALESAIKSLQNDVDHMDLTTITNHLTAKLNTEGGAHGLRYWNDELQFNNGQTWVTIETGAGGLPPTDMKSVEVLYGNNSTSLVLKGADPDDGVGGDGQTLVKWQGTKIVRKVGSYPTKVTDGTLVCDYQVRNQYKNTGFTDTGLVRGTTYYYRWFPYSDQGVVNVTSDETVNRASKSPEENMIVGVTADWANNTYTRTDKAVGQSAGTFFDKFKAFGGRRRCIVADDKTILAFHGDSAYTETGKLTKKITKNGKTYAVGTSVQVMVYQPKFYYKVTPITKVSNPYNTGFMIRKATYQVADVQYAGFKVHPDFVRSGKKLPYILVSAFECATQDAAGNYITTNASLGTKLASIAGAKPSTHGCYNGSSWPQEHSFTRAIARNLAKARGEGWQIGDMLTIAATQLLAMIEYGGMDLQTLLDRGNVDNVNNYNGVLATGGTSSLGNKSGHGAGDVGKRCMSYRGEENIYGNVWTWQDGGNTYNSNQGILYWADHGFADDTTSAPYQSTGFNFARANGYISAYGYSDACDFMFIPCEVTGDSANPVGDYFYQNVTSSNMTVALLGGSCSDGSRAGLFFWYVYDASSFSGWAVGSRLVCVPDEDAVEELPEELLMAA